MELAAAFDLEVTELRTGFTSDTLATFGDEYLCPTCGSLVVGRESMPHEYGDDLVEIFDCGFIRGGPAGGRPCPKDPRFPTFEDYDLTFREEADGRWSCFALGRTRFARQVSLDLGRGRTKMDAELWVKRSYIRARDGYAAAEKFLNECLPRQGVSGDSVG
jgi:hypothetical protein